MSLDFNLTKIKNHKKVCYRPAGSGKHEMEPLTQSIILATMAIGMGEITEKNHEKFHDRIRKFEKVAGCFMQYRDGTPRQIHYEDIVRHIGLTTNVFPMESEKRFMSKLGKIALSKALDSADVR